MTSLPFGPEWPAGRDDVARHTDEATLADRYATDPPAAGRRTGPIPAPCPVCLKHVGHYEDRHTNPTEAAA